MSLDVIARVMQDGLAAAMQKDESSKGRSHLKSEVGGFVGEMAKIFKDKDNEESSGPLSPVTSALVTRTKADAMNVMIPSAGSTGANNQVLRSGPLKKRDGMIQKKWIDVHVELRENCLTCFSSADKSSIVETLDIDADIEFTLTVKDKLPALIIKKASARSAKMMAKELVLGAETEGLRNHWAETLDACCLKARSRVEAQKMVKEEAVARVRREAELQRKALEDAARNRAELQRRAQLDADETAEGATATFELDDLDDSPHDGPRFPSEQHMLTYADVC